MRILYNKRGLLKFHHRIPDPSFWRSFKFRTKVFGISSRIDHIVITFPSAAELKKYTAELIANDGIRDEHFGIWPIDFCEEMTDFPEDLYMYFGGVRFKRGKLILVATVNEKDQLDRFLETRSRLGIHHIAVRTNNLEAAILDWGEKGFNPISETIDAGSFKQLFVRNEFGQVIELILRKNDDLSTFSSKSISQLRRSEVLN